MQIVTDIYDTRMSVRLLCVAFVPLYNNGVYASYISATVKINRSCNCIYSRVTITTAVNTRMYTQLNSNILDAKFAWQTLNN